jgi:hypothetical protein
MDLIFPSYPSSRAITVGQIENPKCINSLNWNINPGTPFHFGDYVTAD